MIFLAVDGGMIALMVIAFAVIFPTMIGLIIYLAFKRQENQSFQSQRFLTDKELFLLISQEPDQMMTSRRLAEKTELTLKQAKNRLSFLLRIGVLTASHDSRLKSFYSLREPVEEVEIPDLSDEPFLTVEDILLLFKAHDFKLTYQKACISTGLPVSVIKEEFSYFVKQKIMTQVWSPAMAGQTRSKMYLLKEPYRSNPDKFIEREEQMNLDLQKIYVKEMRQ